MSLTDVMSAAGQAVWAQIALLIAFAAFVGVVINAILRPRAKVDRAARMPLDEEPRVERRAAAPPGERHE